MAQYVPPGYQQPRPPPVGGARSRASSNASMNKYVPGNYQPPPVQQTPYPTSRSRGPSIDGQPITSTPPIPQTGSYGPPQGMPIPHRQIQPSPLGPPMYEQNTFPPSVERDSYMQPPTEPRRHSAASSAHSRRSHESHHSRPSHHSSRSHRSSRSQRSSSSRPDKRRSDDRDRSRMDYFRRNSHDERELPPPKRVSSHRPSWGDTLYAMFGVMKSALGPRDKY